MFAFLRSSGMEKIYNVAPTKIDIEGFGSVMIRSNHVDRRAIEEMLRGIKFKPNPDPQPLSQVETPPVYRSLPIAASQVPEVVRCACGKPGNYWGVGLAFPDPLCDLCVKARLYPRRSYSRILVFILSILLSVVIVYGVNSILTRF